MGGWGCVKVCGGEGNVEGCVVGWGCVMCKGVWRGGVGRVGMCDV